MLAQQVAESVGYQLTNTNVTSILQMQMVALATHPVNAMVINAPNKCYLN